MFTLNIVPTFENLEAMKRELLLKLPEVKSSHRCEALARGLGFPTYASARAASATNPIEAVRVNGARFREYLSAHGFELPSTTLYDAAAKVALCNVSDKVGRLTMWGMGIGPSQRREDGQRETARDRDARFQQDREELRSDYAVRPFLVSLALLARVTPTKTIRSGTGSYLLKHIAEKYTCTYPEGERLGPHYVPNGAVSAAAVHAGFRIKCRYDDWGQEMLNVTFNMSQTCIEDLDCEMRPDGGRAEDRRRKQERQQSRARYGRTVTPFVIPGAEARFVNVDGE